MSALLRLALSAGGVALAIWLAPASIHIVSWPASGPVRIAFLPPLMRLWLAAAGTAAVFAALALARKRDVDGLARRVSPLALLLLWLVPYLPWIPDRAPLLLLFAGPLRWAVAAAAVIGIIGWLPRIRFNRAAILGVTLAVYLASGIRHAHEEGFGGDEPHYLIITHSLLADRDLDIANNHAQRDYRTFFGGTLRPDFLRRGIHGEIYSIHAPGLPAILLPAYALAGADGAVVIVALIGALTALAVFDLAVLMTGSSGVGVLVWAATALTIPFAPHAWLIYPEIAGALLVAWAALWLRQAPPSAGRAAWHGAALALLPWLHTKFVIFLGLFVVFEMLRLWPRVKQMAALLAPVAVSLLAWLYSFYRMYGVIDPEAPYGTYTATFVRFANVPRGVLGLLIDQKFGLLVYSPVYALALAGAWLMLRDRENRAYAAALLLGAMTFSVSSTRLYMWWGGASAPARFLVPIVPLAAPMIAVAIARLRGPVARAAIGWTLAISLAIAVAGVISPRQRLLYSDPHGWAAVAGALQGSAPLDVSLPTFTEENWLAALAVLAPWLLAANATGLAVSVAVLKRRLQTPFWIGAVAVVSFITGASILAGLRATPDRAAAVSRGQLAMLGAFDPSRSHALDVTHMQRLSSDDVLAAGVVSIPRPPGNESDRSRVVAGPMELPEGRYEARIWFDGNRPREGEAYVSLAQQVRPAKAEALATNPVLVPFELPITASASIGLTDTAAAAEARLVELVPMAVVPRSQRLPSPARLVEPIGGSMPGYIAYVDERTYPEGGVFWTRDTSEGAVVIVAEGATALRLILHVGANGGLVHVKAGTERFDVDMKADETHELTVPLPGEGDRGAHRFPVSVRASRSFRPAEVDPRSDDTRRLGCQVRALLQ